MKALNLIKRHKRTLLWTLSLLTVIGITAGITMAYLKDKAPTITNNFDKVTVACGVEETFDGMTKKNVNVRNTGTTDAYLRVRLVAFRKDNEDVIGGKADIPAFTPGDKWVKQGEFYYYTLPVKPGEMPDESLIPGMMLQDYTDVDGGVQDVTVLAEAIQAAPQKAVQTAWKVTISEGVVTPYSGS